MRCCYNCQFCDTGMYQRFKYIILFFFFPHVCMATQIPFLGFCVKYFLPICQQQLLFIAVSMYSGIRYLTQLLCSSIISKYPLLSISSFYRPLISQDPQSTTHNQSVMYDWPTTLYTYPCLLVSLFYSSFRETNNEHRWQKVFERLGA